MSTMYSRSIAMLRQAKNAILSVSEASTITDWEESSRYGKGVRTTVQTIQRVHNIYESMNQAFLKTQEKNNAGDGDVE